MGARRRHAERLPAYLARCTTAGKRLTPAHPGVRLKVREHFVRNAFAREQGTLHLPVPDRGGFGAGPVQHADGRPQGSAVGGPYPLRPVRPIGSSGKLVCAPDLLAVVERLAGLLAEIAHEVGDYGIAAPIVQLLSELTPRFPAPT
jgi:hypothetical protein